MTIRHQTCSAPGATISIEAMHKQGPLISSLRRSNVTEPVLMPLQDWRLQTDPQLVQTEEQVSKREETGKLNSDQHQHYISRLPFHALPGKTSEVERQLGELKAMIIEAGGERCRILRPHFASDGAPDLVLEQEVDSLAVLESQISSVTATARFQAWTSEMSPLLVRSPKREILIITNEA